MLGTWWDWNGIREDWHAQWLSRCATIADLIEFLSNNRQTPILRYCRGLPQYRVCSDRLARPLSGQWPFCPLSD